MTIIAGIDLGTTNCCVAIPADADVPGKQALIDRGRLQPYGGALIVADRDLSPTTPSAVWLAADGTPVVGALAKQKARLPGSPPALYFKRNMGTDQLVTAGHRILTPSEASTHLLRHLKTMAQDALGVPMERAVVTVPAYFEAGAKNQTTQAGSAAGLEVVATLMEPVAAALAHLREQSPSADAPRRCLIYDLGGGTFDTSVVNWDPTDGFDSPSFDGNRYLGGYDFDQTIVDWIRSRLPAYDLDFQPGRPRADELLSELLSLAEKTKHRLSNDTVADIVSQDMEDLAGLPMTINLQITRREFERLIEGHLRGTLDHCAEALAKARTPESELTEIILVGGSSRIPMVQRLLEERFGIRPTLTRPELVVAAGAALHARTAGIGNDVLELRSPQLQEASADISGRVLRPTAEPQRIEVTIEQPEGHELARQVIDPDGAFLFINLPLADIGDTSFRVRVTEDGKEIGTAVVSANRSEPPNTGTGPENVLAHDFSVELIDGRLARVVKEGTKVPHVAHYPLETARRGSALRLRLFEGRIPIGSVEIPDLPASLAPGTLVDLTIRFEAEWTIEAEVRIPSIDRRATATIDIPIRKVPDWSEINTRTNRVRSAWRQVANEVHRTESAKAAPELEKRLVVLEQLIASTQDRGRAHYLMLEAETIVQELQSREDPAEYLDPSPAEFDKLLSTSSYLIRKLARDHVIDPEPYRFRLDSLETNGHSAAHAGDVHSWRGVNESADDLLNELVEIEIGSGTYEPPTAEEKLDWMRRKISDTDGHIRRKYEEFRDSPRFEHRRKELPTQRDGFLAELRGVAESVNRVVLGRESTLRELRAIDSERLGPLMSRVEDWGKDVGVERHGQ